MDSVCSLCNQSFKRKSSLTKHLTDNRCKAPILEDLLQLHNLILNLKNNKRSDLSLIGNNNSHNILGDVNVNINNNINIILDINSINKLTTDHIEPEKMKEFIEEYTYPNLNLFLSGYIKDLICNKDQPQNHSVKYVTKNPPRFNSIVENKKGEKINVINNLKDSCQLLLKPVLDTLEMKLNECLKKYRNDEDFMGDCEYEIKDINKELNKESVKKALSTVLQNDILTDIQMKLKKM